MSDIARILLRIIFLFIILLLVTRIFKRADEKAILSPGKSFYSAGNAPDSTRMEIIGQLNKFQDGYTKRDPKNLDTFMITLFSRENVLILGTMPNEIYNGFKNAGSLVKSDWESWGDCRFETDSANISSAGNIAWFSTRGYVKFDMSKLLTIPLRLSGIIVKEDSTWKFRQLQFQFDIDFSFSLIATLLISGWILVCIITLSVKAIKVLRIRRQTFNH